MLGLCIDTVSSTNHAFLFDREDIGEKKSWTAHQNEAEKILPVLQRLLQKRKNDWKDVTHIVCVKGPGKFTSTRVGIMIANTLAHTLHIPLIGIDLFDCLVWRLKKEPLFPLRIYIETTRGDFFTMRYVSKTKKLNITLSEKVVSRKKEKVLILRKDEKIEGDFTKKDFLPFEQGIMSYMQHQNKEKYALLEPLYIREANITVRKKR